MKTSTSEPGSKKNRAGRESGAGAKSGAGTKPIADREPRSGKKSRTSQKSCAVGRATKGGTGEPGRLKGSGSSMPRKAKPGRGTETLVDAINDGFATDSGSFVTALFKKAKSGDIPSSRLLVQIVHESTAPESDYDPEIAALRLPRPEDLAAEPQWVDPRLGSVWVGDHWEDPDKAPDAIARARADEELRAGLNRRRKSADPPADDSPATAG